MKVMKSAVIGVTRGRRTYELPVLNIRTLYIRTYVRTLCHSAMYACMHLHNAYYITTLVIQIHTVRTYVSIKHAVNTYIVYSTPSQECLYYVLHICTRMVQYNTIMYV